MNFSPRTSRACLLDESVEVVYIWNEIHFQDRIFFPCWTKIQFTEDFLDCLDNTGSHEANTECHCSWRGRGVGFSLLYKASSRNHPDCYVNVVYHVSTRCLEFKKRVRMRLTCQLEDQCSYLDDHQEQMVERLKAFFMDKDWRSKTPKIWLGYESVW